MCKEKCKCVRLPASNLKGVDPKIAMHILHEDPTVKPVKQKLRRFGAKKDEIIKQ